MTLAAIPFAIVMFVIVIISLTFHEYAHAATANALGDPTAKHLGRLSLNPLVHIDPIGTVLLPLMLSLIGLGAFGWAKPVPVNPGNFRRRRRDEALVSIAGPGANLVLATLATIVVRLLNPSANITEAKAFILFIFLSFIRINIFLMVFNMLPIMPLDGSGVIQYFMSPITLFAYRQMGQKLILIFMLIFLLTNWFHRFYLFPVSNLFLFILQKLAGVRLTL